MELDIRLFGGLASRAGSPTVTVSVPTGADVAALREAIAQQQPVLAEVLPSVKIAVDLEVATPDTVLSPSSEVALLPPVAGGSGLPAVETIGGVRIVTGLLAPPLPLEDATTAITTPEVGGTAIFLGSVRDHAPDLDGVVRLDYSAYARMADRVLADIARDITDAHPQVRGIVLLHAVGELDVGEHTILIACAAAHRGPAFDACRAALERVKDEVPVWKREHTADGRNRWVGLEAPPD